MKPQSLFILLFTVLTSVISLQAQFYVGAQGGVGIATQNWGEEYSRVNFEPMIRPQGGVLAGYQLSNTFALQTEVNYLTKGTYIPYQSFGRSLSLTRTISFNYFEIPLLVRYSLPNVVKSLDIDILVGGSVGILESVYGKGYTDTTGINGSTGRIELDTQVLKGRYQAYDISVGGGLGIRYAVSSSGQIFCTGRYMVGLTDIEPNINFSTQNRTLHLSLGYMLTL